VAAGVGLVEHCYFWYKLRHRTSVCSSAVEAEGSSVEELEDEISGLLVVEGRCLKLRSGFPVFVDHHRSPGSRSSGVLAASSQKRM
jgi:hypothetical protein